MIGEAGEPFARRSISLLRSLADGHEDNARFRDELAKSYYQLADLHLARLQYKDAILASHAEAKILEDLIERSSTDSDYRDRYLEAQGTLGYLLRSAGEH